MIPLCNAFGYAVFLVVALEWLGITGVADGQFGLTYTLGHLGRNLATGPTVPLVVAALAVALPVLGANLLADGLRKSLRPWQPANRETGWPRHPRTGRQPAGGPAGPGTTPDARRSQERGRSGRTEGARPGRDQRAHAGHGQEPQSGRNHGGQRGGTSRREQQGEGATPGEQRGGKNRSNGQRDGRTRYDDRR